MSVRACACARQKHGTRKRKLPRLLNNLLYFLNGRSDILLAKLATNSRNSNCICMCMCAREHQRSMELWNEIRRHLNNLLCFLIGRSDILLDALCNAYRSKANDIGLTLFI